MVDINYKELSIFLVAYKSNFEIEKIISQINPLVNIIIVENSKLQETKNYFEKKYKNIQVILAEENKGQTGGINIGLKNIKTKYSLYLDMDVDFDVKLIDEFYLCAEKIKDFVILAPEHHKSRYPKNFTHNEKNDYPNLKRMKIVHGHFLFFKMSSVKDIGFYDENIFFYYDETDYCLRAIKKNHKIYILKGAKVNHKDGKSYDHDIQESIEPLKHWHFMWGKFYFNKKHFGFMRAFLVVIPDIFECSFKIPILFFINRKKYEIYCSRLLGLYSSIKGEKSWKRPN